MSSKKFYRNFKLRLKDLSKININKRDLLTNKYLHWPLKWKNFNKKTSYLYKTSSRISLIAWHLQLKTKFQLIRTNARRCSCSMIIETTMDLVRHIRLWRLIRHYKLSHFNFLTSLKKKQTNSASFWLKKKILQSTVTPPYYTIRQLPKRREWMRLNHSSISLLFWAKIVN
jgi:hypothetical protein